MGNRSEIQRVVYRHDWQCVAEWAKAYRGLVWTGIAGMAKEALRVLRRDGIERRGERLVQSVGGAGSDFAQPALHFRNGLWHARASA